MSEKDKWQEFSAAVAARLDKGVVEYGDKSFSKDPEVLIQEINEELYDVSAWSFILWSRLNSIPKPFTATGGRGVEDRIVQILQGYDGYCLDSEEEIQKIAKSLTRALFCQGPASFTSTRPKTIVSYGD